MTEEKGGREGGERKGSCCIEILEFRVDIKRSFKSPVFEKVVVVLQIFHGKIQLLILAIFMEWM